MKKAVRYLMVAVVVGLLATALLKAGRLEREIAGAQRDVITEHYDNPDATFETAERYFEYGSRVPGFGNGPMNDMRARRAALHYWKHDYDKIVPQQEDPVAGIAADNIDLQVIVANAIYRARRAEAKDKDSLIEALNSSINAYSTALKNAKRREDAAFNYEYLLRLREEVEKAKKPGLPDELADSQYGFVAVPVDRNGQVNKFKVLVPLDQEQPTESGAGKAAPLKRKG